MGRGQGCRQRAPDPQLGDSRAGGAGSLDALYLAQKPLNAFILGSESSQAAFCGEPASHSTHPDGKPAPRAVLRSEPRHSVTAKVTVPRGEDHSLPLPSLPPPHAHTPHLHGPGGLRVRGCGVTRRRLSDSQLQVESGRQIRRDQHVSRPQGERGQGSIVNPARRFRGVQVRTDRDTAGAGSPRSVPYKGSDHRGNGGGTPWGNSGK